MSIAERRATQAADVAIAMNIELLVIPVSDPDRSRTFYQSLGWHLDIDHSVGDDYRIVQFSPPGSGCAIMFGTNITAAAPGSAQGMHLVVSNIDNVREDLLRRGIAVSDPFHDVGGIFHHSNGKGITAGPNPDRKSYASYITFEDPDGNGWTVQEITARLPGIKGDTRFTAQLSEAVWRASK
ncbi:VOC family protein [Rhizobium ruizarguesonis]|uniref:VOC family protein n=1 Tax=Rhizobium ruizarguesonis TaxID=2081791 RepID=UPI000381E1FA|nr:VOC family protein [Rhizobium ruizarguesonis]NEH75061.1 glyoxalase [Rhizobium ruizarguesonis]NEI76088.1 glyoxalase [Rhizobium ruizarguesonis]TBC70778.1 glyoxalase [Rhizobium ruizarguesonis]TBE38892.1 glyoxalase [Rhizobium ruizarguesonis]WSH61100.1 glyoxalase [Rhizobium ruizarguesonis]